MINTKLRSLHFIGVAKVAKIIESAKLLKSSSFSANKRRITETSQYPPAVVFNATEASPNGHSSFNHREHAESQFGSAVWDKFYILNLIGYGCDL